MGDPIISVSGLRGIIGESLNPGLAMRYAAAFACCIEPGSVVITRDGRSTGAMLAAALGAQLSAMGRDVIDCGIAATPTTGILVREYKAAGGIQISASHNPAEYNGMKLFSSQGRVVPAEFGGQVLNAYHAAQSCWSTSNNVGNIDTSPHDTTQQHWKLIENLVDVSRIRQRRFRTILDSNHGAGSLLGRRLLEELGCQITLLGDKPDGAFEHIPEPTEANLSDVARQVGSDQVDVVFCQDPDADRLAIIDETGRYVGEEYTLALCVDHVLRLTKGPVVTNCATSRMSEDLAIKHGVPFFRSAVGEANVVDTMLQEHAIIGGEGNGGVIDPRVVLVRDSFVGMALILDSLSQGNRTIGQLVDELPRYYIKKTKISLPSTKVPEAMDALQRANSDARVDRLDGIRLDWEDSWLLVRASNTEPVVRAIAEASNPRDANRLCAKAAELLSSLGS